jgi:hypothetical protein
VVLEPSGPIAGSGRATRLVPARGDLADHGRAHVLARDPARPKDPCRRGPIVADEAEQDVLGPDRRAPEVDRLTQRQLERLLRTGGEGDVAAAATRSAAGRGPAVERARPERLPRDGGISWVGSARSCVAT